jgi:hypothetical protein
MSNQATYEDVNLVLKLYEMRREEKMRAARSWFAGNFLPTNMEEFMKVAPPGSDENAYFRQVVSYWEMVAGFITQGVLNQELFFQSGQEMLLTYTRLKQVLPQIRETFKNPNAYLNLEKVSKEYINYMNRNDAGTYAAFEARINGMVKK